MFGDVVMSVVGDVVMSVFGEVVRWRGVYTSRYSTYMYVYTLVQMLVSFEDLFCV